MNDMGVYIRNETHDDISAIDTLNREAFGSEDEPKLVRLLRDRGELVVSLVAVDGERIVGHVAASPVKIDGNECAIVGLGPLAVYESHRKQGIGAMLMEAIVKQVRKDGYIAAVLLGNPDYYPRFGFSSGSVFGLENEYDAGDSFMAIELQPTALENITGLVQYASAFAECDS